jgi:Phosphatidylinositol-4-phosphate 5-Kinase
VLSNRIFDLKGSLYSRSVKSFEKKLGEVNLNKSRKKISVVRGKDRDFLRQEKYFRLKASKEETFRLVGKDADFLASLGLIDYSVLYSVTEHLETPPDDIGFCEKFYHFGVGAQETSSLYIIDYFQSFDNYKQWETLLKQFIFGQKCNFSIIDPLNYALRLKNFIKGVLVDEKQS